MALLNLLELKIKTDRERNCLVGSRHFERAEAESCRIV